VEEGGPAGAKGLIGKGEGGTAMISFLLVPFYSIPWTVAYLLDSERGPGPG
jgi:hypothetical protein